MITAALRRPVPILNDHGRSAESSSNHITISESSRKLETKPRVRTHLCERKIGRSSKGTAGAGKTSRRRRHRRLRRNATSRRDANRGTRTTRHAGSKRDTNMLMHHEKTRNHRARDHGTRNNKMKKKKKKR